MIIFRPANDRIEPRPQEVEAESYFNRYGKFMPVLCVFVIVATIIVFLILKLVIPDSGSEVSGATN